MSGNIKGITIEFRGNATPLQKAIRQVDSELKKTDAELRKINNALKFNPTSVDLWKQKQQLLKEKISETETKLRSLKDAQKQMDASGVDKNSEEYRKLQREIIETQSKLKTFKGQLSSIGSPRLQALGEQFKAAGAKIEGAGRKLQGLSAAAGVAVGAVGALTYKSGQWADDLNTMSKKYHLGTVELQKYGAAAQLVDVDVDTIAKSHTKLTKAMSGAEDETGAQAEAFKKLGISVTDADGNLRNADEVWQETIKALGEVENETERDALAMTLMGKSAAELNPLIEDGGETYENLAKTMEKYNLEFVDQETLDNANAFNDSIDTIKTIGMIAFQTLGTKLAEYLAPALEKVVGWVGRFAEWITKLDPKVLAIITGIAGLLAVLAPVLIVIGKISTGIGALIQVFSLLAGPMGIAILVIGALVAAGILLYKNWDKIKAKAIELKQQVATAFQNLKTSISTAWDNIKTKAQTTWAAIKTAITTPITNAITAVKEKVSALKTSLADAWASIKDKASTAWTTIKDKITGPFEKAKTTIEGIKNKIAGWFPISIGNIFSNVKTPHFTLKWGSKDFGKLGSISYPTGLDVGWWKTGGIFDSPSIIGVGEAGAEAVVPLDKFWEKMDQMGSGQNIVININGANKDPYEIANEVKRILIRETNQRRLAWQ